MECQAAVDGSGSAEVVMAKQERWTGRAGNMQWRGVVQAYHMVAVTGAEAQMHNGVVGHQWQ